MKTKIKLGIGIAVVAIIAVVYFSNASLQKGSISSIMRARPAQDLVVDSVFWEPTTAHTGEQISIKALIKNQGTASVGVVSEARLQIDGVTQTVPQSFTTGPNNTPTLGAGATAKVIFAAWPAIIGSHRLDVCADVTALVAESNEANNCRSVLIVVVSPVPPACRISQYTCSTWGVCTNGRQISTNCTANPGVSCIPPATLERSCTVQPPALPDLEIENVEFRQHDTSGQITANITVKNVGTAPLVVTQQREYVSNFVSIDFLAIDGTYHITRAFDIDGRNPLGTWAPGQIITTGQWLGDVVNHRVHDATRFRFTIDSENTNLESNEANNTFEAEIPVSMLW